MALTNMTGLKQDQKVGAYTEFVAGLKNYVGSVSGVQMAKLFEEQEEAIVRDGGERARDMYEVGQRLGPTSLYRFDRFLTRISQEMMWDAAWDTVQFTKDDILAWYENPTQEYSTIELHPEIEYPNYFKNVEIHVQPGGFHSNPLMGPIYQLGGDIYSLQTRRVTRGYQGAFAELFRDLNPKKVLDLGCGIGKSIWSIRDAYPEAEVWSTELSGDFLRWAQFRAEHDKRRINFVQQNAEDLFRFQDGEFDLVVADILFHEIPPKARKNVIAEAFRVLRKGGQFAIADIEPEKLNTPYQRYITEWQRTDNGEPFWSTHLASDYPQMMREAGFSEATEFGLVELAGGRKFPWIRLGTK